jgi:hypothetical protein
MLGGKQNLSLKKAVFEVENAWHGGILNYDYFCKDIANMVELIQTALQQEGHSLKNDLAKKWMCAETVLEHHLNDVFAMQKGNKSRRSNKAQSW